MPCAPTCVDTCVYMHIDTDAVMHREGGDRERVNFETETERKEQDARCTMDGAREEGGGKGEGVMVVKGGDKGRVWKVAKI